MKADQKRWQARTSGDLNTSRSAPELLARGNALENRSADPDARQRYISPELAGAGSGCRKGVEFKRCFSTGATAIASAPQPTENVSLAAAQITSHLKNLPVASPPRAASFFDMGRINDDQNKTTRSSLGKTSGVFMVTDPSVGVVLAVVKPVKEPEIFANKLYSMLGMPIPNFDVVDNDDVSGSITTAIKENANANTPKTEKIMVMETVLGRAMSEYDGAKLKEFLLIDRNLELLGKTMVLDIFAGNADRIVPFMAKTINPDNIMFRENSVVFIDQAFRERSGQKEKVLSLLADVVGRDPAMPDNDGCIYSKYILPLVDKSLQKYGGLANPEGGSAPPPNTFFEDFKSSIDFNQKIKINKLVKSGICDAVQLLIDSKTAVLNLSGTNQSRRKDLEETYTGLKQLSSRFQEEKSC